jgi:hypothetical protein
VPEFDSMQVNELLKGTRFVDAPGERPCPACGKRAVRTYVYRVAGNGRRPARISYSWCANCRRFKGWTGPDLGDLEFDDPLAGLSPAQRQEAERDIDAFFRRLDTLWESGELPQHFTRVGH